jgi:hypothetical protein
MSRSLTADFILPYRSLLTRVSRLSLTGLTALDEASIACDVDMHGSTIVGLLPPVDPNDLATKLYADNTFAWPLYLTTKGDLVTHDGTVTVALHAAPDTRMLRATPASPVGMLWTNYFSSRGALLSRTAVANTFVNLTNGSVLRTRSASPAGIFPFDIWTAPSAYGSLLTIDNAVAPAILPRGADDRILVSSSVSPGMEWVFRTVRTIYTTEVLGAGAPDTMDLAAVQSGRIVTLYVSRGGFITNNQVLTMTTFFAVDQVPVSDMVFSVPMDQVGAYYMASLWCTAGSRQAILSRGPGPAEVFPISGIANYFGFWTVQYTCL